MNISKKQKKKSSECHGPSPFPDHSGEFTRLNRIAGQLDGVRKMIEEGRYCPQIIQQVRATRSALLALESALLESHLRHCVADAMKSKGTKEQDQKIQELLQIFVRSENKGVGG